MNKLNALSLAICTLYTACGAAQQSSDHIRPWQQFTQSETAIPRLNNAPLIDGELSTAEWQNARVITEFVEFRPTVGGTPRYPITAYVAYDEQYFYVAAKITQPANTIMDRVLTQGERIWNEDYFGLIIDTNHDKSDGYLFHVTPSGVREDGLVNGTEYIAEWKTLWYAKTQQQDDGWTVEIAIPMQSMSFDPDAKNWGLQLRHKLSSPYVQSFWNLNNPNSYGWHASQTAPISGLNNLDQGLGVEVKPGLAYKETLTESRFEPSLDATYRFTPSLTGQLTLNTDFSGTDVDEIEMNMTRFGQYYSEKRDFFLQDSQIFRFGGMDDDDYNGMPFYSRRIGQGPQSGVLDVNWGTKLTGRIGSTDLGILSVNQERDGHLEETTQLSVARAKQHIGEHHQLGAIFTHGSADDNHSQALTGIDYRFDDLLFGEEQFIANAFYQSIDVPNETADSDGKSYGLAFKLPNDKFYLDTKYRYIGKDFNPAMGFVNRTDLKYYHLTSHYRVRPQSGWLGDNLNFYQVRTYYKRWENTEGEKKGQQVFVQPLVIQTQSHDYFSVSYDMYNKVLRNPFEFRDNIQFAEGEYDYNQWNIYYETASDRPVFVSGRLVKGDFFDADLERFSLTINTRPNKHLYVQLGRHMYYYERAGEKSNMYNTRLKVNIAFNSEWSWNSLLQHNTQSDSFSLFSRLRYEPAPDELYQLSINKGYDLEDGWHDKKRVFSETAIKLNYTYRW